MLDLLIKGGPVLWVIIALAFPVIAAAVERILFFRTLGRQDETLLARVKGAVERGHFEEALAICDTVEGPTSALVRSGIENRDLGEEKMKEAIRDAAAHELPRLEKNVALVGTIANIAPLLGLLGTVSGIINAFGILGQFGAVSDPSVLAKGISEALLTTAAGIILAVPAMVVHSFLTVKVNNTISRLEGQSGDLVRILVRQGGGK